jgi:hypothetical protein
MNHVFLPAQKFTTSALRPLLPSSIRGLWKADLFLGCTDSDRWIGTTVKINPTALVGAQGLRLGIVPAHQGRSDNIYLDNNKNLVVCPIPYDGSFMEIFYHAWGIVVQFLAADANLPKEVSLPSALHRQVAQELASRREFNVVEVIAALTPIAQPWLLTNVTVQVPVDTDGMETEALISPIPLYI